MEDHESKFQEVVAGYSTKIQEAVRSLHNLIQRTAPGLMAHFDVNKGSVVYHYNGNVCALTPKEGRVQLYFYDANRLDDPRNLLGGEGKSYVIIRSLDDIDHDALRSVVRQAYEIHQQRTNESHV